jgi:hypothetical protein
VTAFNGLQASPDQISQFETQAAGLAAQIPGLPGGYPTLNVLVDAFGGADFPAASTFSHNYDMMQAALAGTSASNVSDLQDQVNLFATGAGNAADGYSTTAANETTIMNNYKTSVTQGGG